MTDLRSTICDSAVFFTRCADGQSCSARWVRSPVAAYAENVSGLVPAGLGGESVEVEVEVSQGLAGVLGRWGAGRGGAGPDESGQEAKGGCGRRLCRARRTHVVTHARRLNRRG